MLDQTLRWFSRISLPVLAVLQVNACGGGDEEAIRAASLSEGCVINSDCESPLVCAFRRCHDECETSRDCPEGQRCLASDRPFHVCQLADETNCAYNSECPPGLVCAVDTECRDQCGGDRDCVPGQVCVGGACADPEELDDSGKLPESADTETAVSGQVCTHDSQCRDPLVCRSGVCRAECLESRDCPVGDCVDGRCVAPPPVTVDAGDPPGIPDPECVYNSDCAAGLRCIQARCLAECVESRDCSAGETCESGVCVRPPPTISDAGAGNPDATVVDPGPTAECVFNSDCVTAGTGFLCVRGSCQNECATAIDCSTGEICSAGQCVFVSPPGAPPGYGEECNVSSDCDPGLLCRPPGRCVFECLMNADCGTGFCCSAEGVCLTGPACSDGGPIGDPTPLPDLDGGPCISDLKCQDGIQCNGFERCMGGVCQPAARTACDDGNPCTADSCDESAGTCTHIPTGILQDADGDGHYDVACGGTGDDCDDRNPAVHPGVAEVCDGVDNNCDGLVDESGWDVEDIIALPALATDAGTSTYPYRGPIPMALRDDGTMWVAASANATPDAAIDVWRVDSNLAVLEGPTRVVSTPPASAAYFELGAPRLATNGTGFALGHVQHGPSGNTSFDSARAGAGVDSTSVTNHWLGQNSTCCNPGGQRWPNYVTGPPGLAFNGTDYVMTWTDDSAGTRRAHIAKMSVNGVYNGVSQDVLVTPTENDIDGSTGEKNNVLVTQTSDALFVAWRRAAPNVIRYVKLERNALSVLAGPFDLDTQGYSTATDGVWLSSLTFNGTSVVLAIDEVNRSIIVRIDPDTGAFIDDLALPSTVADPRPIVHPVRGGIMLTFTEGTRTYYGWVPDDLTQGFPLRSIERGPSSGGVTDIAAFDDQTVALSWADGGSTRLAKLTCNATP